MINARLDNNIYKNASPTCKFCSKEGHTLAHCPDMKSTYEQCKDKDLHDRTFKENYAVQYIERKTAKSKLRKKTGKKCGYCRETGHSRKNCPTMQADKELIIKGNKLWRRMYAESAKEFGATPASLLTVTTRSYNYHKGGYETTTNLCTVGAELPENLSVFALGEEQKNQEISIPLLGYKPQWGKPIVNARVLFNHFNEDLARSMFAYRYSNSSINELKVLSTSNYEFPNGWMDEAPIEDIDYSLKKWSREQMSTFLGKINNLITTYGGKYDIS